MRRQDGGSGNEASWSSNDTTLEHVDANVDDVDSNEEMEVVEDAAESVYELVVEEEYEVVDEL